MAEVGNRCGYCALIGRPNVGKSTLLNHLVGVKLAITSHKPQTTRHNIIGVKTRGQGQIIYVDTPGIHERADTAMNRYLNRAAKTVLQDVDVVVFLVEALQWTREDEKILQQLSDRTQPVILAVSKVDLVKQKELLLPFLQKVASRRNFLVVIPLSAKTGSNLEILEKQVLDALPVGENFFPDDRLTDRSERFFAAEMVREQLVRRYAAELPYAVSVEIEKFQEEGDLYRIGAVIWVEKPGQKAILIGKDGEALKQAATQARRAMEAFFERKVYLNVWIKVKKSWSSDESALVRLGYTD